jgi:lipopolysaccharide assembly outer membrane protein LptD (OstA)
MKKILIILIFIILFLPSSYAKLSYEPEINADIMEVLRENNTIIFRNNVKVLYANNILTADLLIKNEKDKIIDAENNVKIYYNVSEGEKLNLVSNSAKYFISEKKTLLWGNSYMLYSSTTIPEIKISAEKITIDENTKNAVFEDKVIISQGKNSAKSELAVYDYTTKKIILSTKNNINPYVEYMNDYKINFEAGKITIFPDKGNFLFEDKVFGRISPIKK